MIPLRLMGIKSLSYRRNASKNPGGLGAEPPETKTEEEISTLPLDLQLDGRSPLEYQGRDAVWGCAGRLVAI